MPYREGEGGERCGVDACAALGVDRCVRCGRPLCEEHTPAPDHRCFHCEVEFWERTGNASPTPLASSRWRFSVPYTSADDAEPGLRETLVGTAWFLVAVLLLTGICCLLALYAEVIRPLLLILTLAALFYGGYHIASGKHLKSPSLDTIRRRSRRRPRRALRSRDIDLMRRNFLLERMHPELPPAESDDE